MRRGQYVRQIHLCVVALNHERTAISSPASINAQSRHCRINPWNKM
jgi:hypothetical protein